LFDELISATPGWGLPGTMNPEPLTAGAIGWIAPPEPLPPTPPVPDPVPDALETNSEAPPPSVVISPFTVIDVELTMRLAPPPPPLPPASAAPWSPPPAGGIRLARRAAKSPLVIPKTNSRSFDPVVQSAICGGLASAERSA
jgi:protein TonB